MGKRYLLDTQILIWFLNGEHPLSDFVIQEIQNQDNEVIVSMVSFWEIALKKNTGKLIMSYSTVQLINFCAVYQFQIIPIDERAIDKLGEIPFIHKDPFDRLLIATCLTQDLMLISTDGSMKGYEDSIGLKLLS
jgi:PIN domain nuclease of toxin-antitoxin system